MKASDDLESLGKCFAYRSISLTGIRLGAGSYDALSSKKEYIEKNIFTMKSLILAQDER